MGLTDKQKRFVEEQHRNLSIRQIAHELGCSRDEVRDYLVSLSQRPRKSEGSIVSRIPAVWLGIIIFALTFVTYSNSLTFKFVWDDKIQIRMNPFLKNPSFKSAGEIFKVPLGCQEPDSLSDKVSGCTEKQESFSYRPIQTLTYFLDHALWKFNPAGYHLTNILLQGITAVFLFILLSVLLDNRAVAFWVASLFAVHPVQIAAVTYVSGRAESLSTLFTLISFYFFHWYQSHDNRKPLFMLGSCAAYFFALLTKELSLISPLLFFCYLWVFKKEKQYQIKPTPFIAYALTFVLYVVIRLNILGQLGQGAIGHLPLGTRILSAFISIAYYIRLLFIPTELHMAYQLPYPQISDSLVHVGAFVAILVAILTWFSRKSPLLLFGWSWFWIFLIPVLNIFVLLNAPMAEHWLYNACVGFFMVAIASLLSSQVIRRWFGQRQELLLAVLLLIFASTTFYSNFTWKNEITLFENIIKYSQRDPDVYSNLGVAYIEAGQKEKAKSYFEKALEIDPNWKNAKHNLEVLKLEMK